MITPLLNSLNCMRSGVAHVTALAVLASLATFSSAQAFVPTVAPDAVTTGDTYSIEVVGYNTGSPSNNIYLIYPLNSPTFGAAQSYTSPANNPMGGLGGQTLTVNSFESTVGGITTDTFSFSVPTNFVPSGTTDNGGNTLNAIEFSIGNYFVPSGNTGNTVDLSTAATGFSATSAITFKANGVTTTSSSAATVTPSNGNKSYSAFGQVTSAGDISNNQITGLSFTITYNAVPEPSTNAVVLLGAAGLIGTLVVRNRRCARA